MKFTNGVQFLSVKYVIKNAEQTIRLMKSVSHNVWLRNLSQLDRKKGTFGIVQRPYMIKKQRMKAIEECEKQLLESNKVPKRLDVREASGTSILLN